MSNWVMRIINIFIMCSLNINSLGSYKREKKTILNRTVYNRLPWPKFTQIKLENRFLPTAKCNNFYSTSTNPRFGLDARTPLIALGWSARAGLETIKGFFFFCYCRCVYIRVSHIIWPWCVWHVRLTWWYFTASGAINKCHWKSSEVTSARLLSDRTVLL